MKFPSFWWKKFYRKIWNLNIYGFETYTNLY